MATERNLGCVVVAVDESEESMNALKWSLENLRLRPASADGEQPAGTFTVLHVQPAPSIVSGISPAAIPFGGPSHVEVPAFAAAIEGHQRRISEAILNHALKICLEKNANVNTSIVVGDPKDVICDFTSNVKADLLVMGCRAIGPIKRMFLGSVSNFCINHVQCPVVVIKGTAQA
ncbi:Universal stress protein A-like protein [Zostera marina]|uniref:Universal stress protein A-like protein n=1 Tax=Zostera marina TaxID=29655 RepID=A0A0K9PHK5_ZOSMR|nr:Universal stress protein A-like protein [Zostera marina]